MSDGEKRAHELAVALEELDSTLSVPMRSFHKKDEHLDDWRRSLRQRIVPRLKGEIPLIVGLCGGGNAGKSTLFNTLVGRKASVASPKAGLTRRALLAIPSKLFAERRDLLDMLFHSFGGIPEPLPEDEPGAQPMCEPGAPLYILTDEGVPNAILVDMPDMDVAGNDGGYANRENAKKVLAACDLLIVLASNTTYNSKEIADFMRNTVSENGRRGAILIYRFARPEKNLEHIHNVFEIMARNLYPDSGNPPVLRRFITLEDPGIMDGSSSLHLISEDELSRCNDDNTPAGIAPLRFAVSDIDMTSISREDTVRNIEQGLKLADGVLCTSKSDFSEVQKFHDAIVKMTKFYAKTSFKEYPFEEFRSISAELWKEEQNSLLKAGRWLGGKVKWPIFKLKKGVDFLRRVSTDEVRSGIPISPKDFFNNAAEFLSQLQSGHLHVPKIESAVGVDAIHDYIEIPIPDVLKVCQTEISGEAYFSKIKNSLTESFMDAVRLPDNARDVLRPIIKEARKNMGLWDVTKEYAACAIDVVMPAAAITYVLTTGDVATGSALGMFEMADLFAVVVVPLAFGNSELQNSWVRNGLNAVVGDWVNTRTPILDKALRETISGTFIEKGESIIAATKISLEMLQEAIVRANSFFGAWLNEGENHV